MIQYTAYEKLAMGIIGGLALITIGQGYCAYKAGEISRDLGDYKEIRKGQIAKDERFLNKWTAERAVEQEVDRREREVMWQKAREESDAMWKGLENKSETQ